MENEVDFQKKNPFFFSGIINVHASLLPRWRGASPIIYAILNEDAVTGVSIMKIHPNKFDIGEILAQKEVQIPKNVLMPHLHETLANEGAQLLLDCIENAPESFQKATQQSDSGVTYGRILAIDTLYPFIYAKFPCDISAPKVPESMAQINWHVMTARYVCNLYRALYSFKWLTTFWHKRRVKIKELDLFRDTTDQPKSDKIAGCIEYDKSNKCLRVYCSDGHFIQIKQLVLEGRPAMTAADFNNGFLKKVDATQRFFT